jgi:hypothetical protein
MKNIFLLTALLSSSLMSYAEESAYPVTQPFALTHSLTIVSEKELKVPKELQQQTLKTQQEMKQKGYHETNNRYAQFLLGLKRTATDEIRAYRGTQNVADTHLKQNLQDIKLAFEFKALPIDNKNIIGYAPIGSYVKLPKEGWNGIKVFFEDKDLGMCAYEFTDLNLSNGGVMLTKEYTKYIVNNKPTFILVEGNDNSGFVYTVTWYNSIKVSTVDCATQKSQKGLTDKILEIAKKIDTETLS